MSFLNCLYGQKRSGQAPRTGHPGVPTTGETSGKNGLGGRKREAESTAITLHKPRAAPRLTASNHAENGRGLTEISIQPAMLAGKHRFAYRFTTFPSRFGIADTFRPRPAWRSDDPPLKTKTAIKIGPNLNVALKFCFGPPKSCSEAASNERVLPPMPNWLSRAFGLNRRFFHARN
ncbi:hypothetical protein [Burkholderia sp. Ac-20353]|uniref:hypothetical protein n=1 Tax=Burkholderia sp. Ac-20353 TaxID=2703894 RepID=UPI00197BDA34|nr:hypothetical protein [Burkholderia sp. Ac-20353]MBN3790865.1 hypothetical protein [Burkholderia sp. Ac-20353]